MKKRSCKKCGKCHPTILHDENFRSASKNVEQKSSEACDSLVSPDQEMSVSSSCNNIEPVISDTVLQAILPVLIQQKGSDKLVKIYALLDNGSTGCFITEDLRQRLETTSTESSLKLRTMHGLHVVSTHVVEGLVVSDHNGDNAVTLPRTFTREEIPVSHSQIPNPDILKKWPHLCAMADKLPKYLPHLDIGLLIGSNCPLALQPQQVIPSQGEGPLAVLYRHGWTVSGPLYIKFNPVDNTLTCNRVLFQELTSAKECLTDVILNMFEMDFNPKDTGILPGERGFSREDDQFIDMANKGIAEVNGHFELPLPLRDPDIDFSNNREQAEKRAMWQRKKMLHDEEYHEHYTAFMDSLLSNGYAYKVPSDELAPVPGKVWYLPHHGVYHPKKPSKIRVVFDCKAKFEGFSLNDRLLQGPDLTNSPIGVLTKFRNEPVAFMADIEAMFYQVRVPPQQHDLLRFLWWPNGDLNSELHEYRMAVHIFGAVSSPSISNFALKAAAKKAEEKYGSLAADTICNNFYVDDCLKSECTEEAAIDLVDSLQKSCAEGGFKLTKFTANSRNFLRSIPQEHHSKELQTRDLDYDELPVERALGMQWHINSDVFGFSVHLKSKPFTRRGLLSTMSSLYDPLGIVAPVLLPAKKILRDLCINKQLGWDDDIPVEYKASWEQWIEELHHLNTLRIERCLKPADFGHIVSVQLHVFSDASTVGYGCVAYLRMSNDEGGIHTAFLIGKSRLAPVKTITVPRLELTAATVSIHIGQLLMKELESTPESVTYHTDSTTVLHYISNETKRFPIFVANRVKQIRDFSEPTQWKYVDSKSNPADVASRGISASHLLTCMNWFHGPKFLSSSESEWPVQPHLIHDEKMLEETVTATDASQDDCSHNTVNKLLEHYSSWYRLKRVVAIYHRLFDSLKSRSDEHQYKNKKHAKSNRSLSVEDLSRAEKSILQFVQKIHFNKEFELLQGCEGTRGRVPRTSSVYKLDPFIESGILKVGGRIGRANIPKEMKHPVILPYRSHVTSLIITDQHIKLAHAGRNHVLSMLRETYWIIKAINSAVRNVLSHCVTSRRLRGSTCDQKMADLPSRRVNPAPPFTFTGVDFYGPFVIKDGRNT
ncbi:uncharacterized protein LOC125377268 [Haliotis rufescens]|uniref:uncharacterized protein LOC125377268 n=1 Tax=Haliotis rufescens TaxID=6454 RepID=UPI00201FA1A3|nr:uncharacterized protein LOC125377268 [Haliotis rufescens]